jgi:hypothetical protein
MICSVGFTRQLRFEKFSGGIGPGEQFDDLSAMLTDIILERTESAAGMSGSVVFSVAARHTPRNVSVQCPANADTLLLQALAYALVYEWDYLPAAAFAFTLTIPCDIPNDMFAVCGSSQKGAADANATLAILRRKCSEDDEDPGHCFYNTIYMGSTQVNRIHYFSVPAGAALLLFQRDPHEDDENDFAVIQGTFNAGHTYYFKQDFIDTPLFHALSAKSIGAEQARELRQRWQLSPQAAPRQKVGDLSVKFLAEVVEEYREDLTDNQEDFVEEYVEEYQERSGVTLRFTFQ